MKEFVKTVLAVICGFIVLQILSFILFMIMFAGALISGGKPALPKSGVLDLDFSSISIAEQGKSTPDFAFAAGMNMNPTKSIGLLDAVKAIETAAGDPSIKFILLRSDYITSGMATLEELRSALAAFRESGKPVIAYTEIPGNGSYYLSTVADKILMGSQHGGTYMLFGLMSQQIFLKDLLDKLGVQMQLIRHGKYKSAGEMFLANSSSKENREQNQILIDSAWKVFSDAIAESRGISVEEFNGLLDNLSLVVPEDFLAGKLVDELVDHKTLQERLCTFAQVEEIKDLHLVPLADYSAAKKSSGFSRSQVAVIYADGEIVDGSASTGVAGDRFVQIIDKARENKSVKAVVLRVNSPGGSVSSSIKIREALDRLQEEKPLVASFGDYAASGGYWIANGCSKIFSDANTVTGSIGVFSILPEFSALSRKLGVNIETIGSNKHSDMLALMRPFDKDEVDYLTESIEDIYDMFVNLVATSRGKSYEEIDEIGQGRIWTGRDALGIGLVDEIGNLNDAICYAAALADLHSSDEYSIASYPAPAGMFDDLLQSFGAGDKTPSILAGTPFEALGYELGKITDGRNGVVYARLPYSLDIR